MYKFTVDRWTGASFLWDCTQNGHDRFVDRKRPHPISWKTSRRFSHKKGHSTHGNSLQSPSSHNYAHDVWQPGCHGRRL